MLRIAAYFAAAVVILLAIALGLFRLFLPRLPEYQEEIKAWASTAIGMQVEFSGMDARWGLSGPEVEFFDTELVAETGRLIAADEVGVGIAVTQLLFDRRAVVDRVVVRGTTLEVRQLENGEWWVQGRAPDALLPERETPGSGGGVGPIEFIVEDIRVNFLRALDERPHVFVIPRLTVDRDDSRVAVDGTIELPENLGKSVDIMATQLIGQEQTQPWDIAVTIDDLNFAGASAMHDLALAKFDSGVGDVDVAMVASADGVLSASADIDLEGLGRGDSPPLAISGHIEYLRDATGWLVAANGYRLETENGVWPLSDLRVETALDADGGVAMLDVESSYIKIDDVASFQPWLKDEHKQLLSQYAPDGLVRNLSVTVSDLDAEIPNYDVVAEFDRIGVGAVDRFPGVRGFSGALRADRSGGRFEIDSGGLSVDLPEFLNERVILDEVSATLIWRHGDRRTTLLSDSIVIRNEDLDIQTNVEVTFADDQTRPIVDLESRFEVYDFAEAKKYVPYIPRIPKTSEWFQEGLLAGHIPNGTVRLHGPLDKWPFDGGEGQFLVQASVRDARIIYQRRWPVAAVSEAEVVIDNMRLYSERNHIVSMGNEVNDARIEIGDFRLPILTVEAYSAGEIDNMRQLLADSPVGEDVFKGNLDRVSTSGSASLDLKLTVPVRDWQSFEFESRIQTAGVRMDLEGFPAPITDLSGVMRVEREDIASESLGGIFLGHPVAIDLTPAPEDLPEYRIIATAEGRAAATALIEELELPLQDGFTGDTDFLARLMFARGDVESPAPFTIELFTDLEGLAIELPEPLAKPAAELVPMEARLQMPSAGDVLTTTGFADGLAAWKMGFNKLDEGWDFDRGVVNFGGNEAGDADTRGLHLQGTAESVRMQDWFDRMRDNPGKTGMGERIRSIDLTIENLYLLGQHVRDHHVRVDRSAQEWLVQLEGTDITGTAYIPYDFDSGRTLVLDMQRLVLPGDDEDSDPRESNIDPRSLPPISVAANEFGVGTRMLGSVKAELIRTADGLETTSLLTQDPSFALEGSGRWVVDEADPDGSRTYLDATLTSTGVEDTMARLDYNPGIVSDDLSMVMELDWSGGPRDDFRDSLNGTVKVRIGSGQLSDVEPGAGRMFGLLSVVALPRRLALDFRDVFGKGFAFDEIRGRFRVENGQTFTCNLSLEGPAAAIGIVGRAGLVDRDYNQTAVVSASFGNALPVVGAAFGGPQVAAVVFLFSRIFKKPLQEMTQVYYGITGSWDEPIVETITAEDFAANGVLAGCLDDVETE